MDSGGGHEERVKVVRMAILPSQGAYWTAIALQYKNFLENTYNASESSEMSLDPLTTKETRALVLAMESRHSTQHSKHSWE